MANMLPGARNYRPRLQSGYGSQRMTKVVESQGVATYNNRYRHTPRHGALGSNGRQRALLLSIRTSDAACQWARTKLSLVAGNLSTAFY